MPFDLAATSAIAVAALVIEAVVGYPQALFRRISHPVVPIGRLIGRLDRALNREHWPGAGRRVSGVVAVLLLLAVVAAVTVPVAGGLRGWGWGWLVEAVLSSSLLAQRSLYTHVIAVADKLELEGLAAGRRAVSMIVGRDPDRLDRAGVSRAAIESLSENFSDGVVSPLLWLLVGGLPGIALYKAVNTADSMIGHHSPRYQAFGWAAARLDDLVNLPGARLSGLLLALGAGWCRGYRTAIAALSAMWRDAGKHRSPNAGWPEAAMAGGLELRLGGPRSYGAQGEVAAVAGAWLGDGRVEAGAGDIRAALAVYVRACILLAGLTLAVTAWAACKG